MKLVQVRPCDGACCRAMPRFPNRDGTDCVYHGRDGCLLRRNPGLIPEGDCPVKPRQTAADAAVYCRQWPQIGCAVREGWTGVCCWQWVE